MSSSSPPPIQQVQLKWNKQRINLSWQLVDNQNDATTLQTLVSAKTGVPVNRQKLLSKAWKGPLKSDSTITLSSAAALDNRKKPLVVTLIGSAEPLREPMVVAAEEKTTASPASEPADNSKVNAKDTDSDMFIIPSLQLPYEFREDGKQEWYTYNRLVQGLPQLQIEKLLSEQQQQQYVHPPSSSLYSSENVDMMKVDEDTTTMAAQHPPGCHLHGKVVMEMGLALRRAYVNDVTVLSGGTLVSVHDDGHLLGWKHAEQVWDVRGTHAVGSGGSGGPLTSVVALPHSTLAAAGPNGVQLYHVDEDDNAVRHLTTLPSVMPGTAPDGLAVHVQRNDDNEEAVLLAALTTITYQAPPNQFRLPPHGAAQRQARAEAEAQASALHRALQQAAASVQVWNQQAAPSSTTTTTSSSTTGNVFPMLRRQILVSPHTTARVTALTFWNRTTGIVLAVGYKDGGIQLWEHSATQQHWMPREYWRLQHLVTNTPTRIVAMQGLEEGYMAVSTDHGTATSDNNTNDGMHILPVQHARAVHIWHANDGDNNIFNTTPTLVSTLTGHVNDCVTCLCALPNGDLLTAGGKQDATLQHWSRAQGMATTVKNSSSSSSSNIPQTHATAMQQMPQRDVGYVFALTVLPMMSSNNRSQSGSVTPSSFAVAAARYNLVKIIL